MWNWKVRHKVEKWLLLDRILSQELILPNPSSYSCDGYCSQSKPTACPVNTHVAVDIALQEARRLDIWRYRSSIKCIWGLDRKARYHYLSQ
jgi:hypothetical protein